MAPKPAAKRSTAPVKSAVKVTTNPLKSPASNSKKRPKAEEIEDIELLDSDDDSRVDRKPER